MSSEAATNAAEAGPNSATTGTMEAGRRRRRRRRSDHHAAHPSMPAKCRLCKRRFASRDELLRHEQRSELHRTNLEQREREREEREREREIGENQHHEDGQVERRKDEMGVHDEQRQGQFADVIDLCASSSRDDDDDEVVVVEEGGSARATNGANEPPPSPQTPPQPWRSRPQQKQHPSASGPGPVAAPAPAATTVGMSSPTAAAAAATVVPPPPHPSSPPPPSWLPASPAAPDPPRRPAPAPASAAAAPPPTAPAFLLAPRSVALAASATARSGCSDRRSDTSPASSAPASAPANRRQGTADEEDCAEGYPPTSEAVAAAAATAAAVGDHRDTHQDGFFTEVCNDETTDGASVESPATTTKGHPPSKVTDLIVVRDHGDDCTTAAAAVCPPSVSAEKGTATTSAAAAVEGGAAPHPASASTSTSTSASASGASAAGGIHANETEEASGCDGSSIGSSPAGNDGYGNDRDGGASSSVGEGPIPRSCASSSSSPSAAAAAAARVAADGASPSATATQAAQAPTQAAPASASAPASAQAAPNDNSETTMDDSSRGRPPTKSGTWTAVVEEIDNPSAEGPPPPQKGGTWTVEEFVVVPTPTSSVKPSKPSTSKKRRSSADDDRTTTTPPSDCCTQKKKSKKRRKIDIKSFARWSPDEEDDDGGGGGGGGGDDDVVAREEEAHMSSSAGTVVCGGSDADGGGGGLAPPRSDADDGGRAMHHPRADLKRASSSGAAEDGTLGATDEPVVVAKAGIGTDGLLPGTQSEPEPEPKPTDTGPGSMEDGPKQEPKTRGADLVAPAATAMADLEKEIEGGSSADLFRPSPPGADGSSTPSMLPEPDADFIVVEPALDWDFEILCGGGASFGGGSIDDCNRREELPTSASKKLEGEDDTLWSDLLDGSVRLSPYHSLVVQNMEVFTATKEDVAVIRGARKSNIKVGNAGFRCIHCKHLPRLSQAKMAVLFPGSVEKISGNMSNMLQHFLVCTEMPASIRQLLKAEKKKTGGSPTKASGSVSVAAYCRAAASILGLEDAEDGGIQFCIDLGPEPTPFSLAPPKNVADEIGTNNPEPMEAGIEERRYVSIDTDDSPPFPVTDDIVPFSSSIAETVKQGVARADAERSNPITYEDGKSTTREDDTVKRVMAQYDSETSSFVRVEDKSLTTGFHYLLLRQLIDCCGHEVEKGIGFRCRHCQEHTWYFRDATEFSHRLVNRCYTKHVKECCPNDVKLVLEHLNQLRNAPQKASPIISPTTYLQDYVWSRLDGSFEHQTLLDGDPTAYHEDREDTAVALSACSGVGAEVNAAASLSITDTISKVMTQANAQSSPIMSLEDRMKTTDYIYLVLKQYEVCFLTEEEQLHTKRRHLALGSAGLRCKHCRKRSYYFGDEFNFRRQFSRKLYGHLKTCTCPRDIQVALEHFAQIREQHKQSRKLMRLGNFYDRLLKCSSNISQTRAMLDNGPAFTASESGNRSDTDGTGNWSNSSTSSSSGISSAARTTISEGSQAVITLEDKPMATDFHFLLLQQVISYRLTEEEKSRGTYQGVSVGQPGLLCKHCNKTGFFFQNGETFRKYSARRLNNHFRNCKHVSVELKMSLERLNGSLMQSQLKTIGNLKPMYQRVWMRLTHDWSRCTEEAANARSIPLFDESDSDSSDYDSDDGYSSDCSSNGVADSEDEEISLASYSCVQSSSTQEPGFLCNDMTHYCTFDNETCAGVAEKLGCSWKELAQSNRMRYGIITATSKFKRATMLQMPETVDLSKLLRLRKPCREKAAVVGRKDEEDSTSTSTASDDSKCPADKHMFQEVDGVGWTCQRCLKLPSQFRECNHTFAGPESSPSNKMGSHNKQCMGKNTRLGRLVESVLGMVRSIPAMSLDVIVDAGFVAVVQALVGGKNCGSNDDLVGLLTESVRDAALNKSNTPIDDGFITRISDNVEVNEEELVQALAAFARSQGGLFNLVQNEDFVDFARLISPECVLPTAREVMEFWQ